MKSVLPAVRRLLEGVFALSKKRLCFSKLGMGKFISHLDLLRAFTRAVLRAELPVRYTQGFNPHQIMTFALPLPIGVTSEAEFVDIDFEETVSLEEIKQRLNENLPPDIRILWVAEPKRKASEIVAARYEVVLHGADVSIARIEAFFEQKEIIVMRRTKKKGEQPANLIEFLHNTEIKAESADCVKLFLTVDAGNERNLKPALLTDALEEFVKPNEFDSVRIHRTDIFCGADKKLESFC